MSILSDEQQPDEECALGCSVGQLLDPVRTQIGAVQADREDDHQDDSGKPSGKEDAGGKLEDRMTDHSWGEDVSVEDQGDRHDQKSRRHEDAHLEKERPDILLFQYNDQFPEDLKHSGDQADGCAHCKKGTVDPDAKQKAGESEKDDRKKVREDQSKGEVIRNSILADTISHANLSI